MNREQPDSVIESNHFLKGGTKEACVTAYTYLKCSVTNTGYLQSDYHCPVSDKKFIDAVRKLMIVAYQLEDRIVRTHCCEQDCCKAISPWCEGQCGIDKTSTNMCPYYISEDK